MAGFLTREGKCRRASRYRPRTVLDIPWQALPQGERCLKHKGDHTVWRRRSTRSGARAAFAWLGGAWCGEDHPFAAPETGSGARVKGACAIC
ncbi:MAG: hypothetical protein AAGD34_18570, partial [Pseudomonadota bacterium]